MAKVMAKLEDLIRDEDVLQNGDEYWKVATSVLGIRWLNIEKNV